MGTSVQRLNSLEKTLELAHLMDVHSDESHAHPIALAAHNFSLAFDAAHAGQLKPEFHHSAGPK